jgi:transposase InsO family protein
MGFFTVPTATFRVLFVFVILTHNRRRVIHANVTDHPTAAWTRQQIRGAFPDQTAPPYLLRDRDSCYGSDFGRLLATCGIKEVVTAPRSPWQNPFVERLIGTLRRECLDHVIVWNERSLRRRLKQFLAYYHEQRTHLSLNKDAPRVPYPPAAGLRQDRPNSPRRRTASPLRTPRRLTVRSSEGNLSCFCTMRDGNHTPSKSL